MAKTATLKETFNELSALEKIYGSWGEASLPFLSEEVEVAVDRALAANNGNKMTFTALDQGVFMKIIKEGPEAVGLEKACEVMLKFLKQADFNMSIMLPFMDAAEAKKLVPEAKDRPRLAETCKKYALTAMQGLLA